MENENGLPKFDLSLETAFAVTELKSKKADNIKFASSILPVPPQDNPQDNSQVDRLLKSVMGDMTAVEIMAKLKISDRQYFLIKYVNPALKSGFIERTIPDKPSSKNQKYRLTEKGKKHLASI